MRYYCESNPQSINHVTPSVLMLNHKLQSKRIELQTTITILDLGCGNGRNSLYLAKKYNAMNVVLVDSDVNMLNWALIIKSPFLPEIISAQSSTLYHLSELDKYFQLLHLIPVQIFIIS